VVTNIDTTNFDLLPGAGLGGELKMFMETTAPSEPFCMQGLLEKIAAHGYRYAVIDLSPAFGTLPHPQQAGEETAGRTAGTRRPLTWRTTALARRGRRQKNLQKRS
jgi:hypothetical protein